MKKLFFKIKSCRCCHPVTFCGVSCSVLAKLAATPVIVVVLHSVVTPLKLTVAQRRSS